MWIRDADVQRVREATDLVALIGRRVNLKRSGSNHMGLCPFHTEKTPSFSVDQARGFYYCFGCQASGDAFTFLQEIEHLEFTDAVEQLAAAANITLTYDDPGVQRANQRRKESLDLLERAARFYHELLMSSPDAGDARAYLRRRGYDRQTVVKWRLGYAPRRLDDLCRHLGAPAAQLAAAGLAYEDSRRGARASHSPRADGEGDAAGSVPESSEQPGDSGTDGADTGGAAAASDFFRDRIMFPICDAGGRVVSFAGRLLPRPDERAAKAPKYKNTAATAVYDKSKVLYGLHLAKQPARKANRIVVCEGYTDVIGCDLAGISEAVATCGTALTQQHAELLSRSAKRIVLAFDADAAGQTAAERVHQWEREYGLDIFVATLPEGSDPGDLAGSSPPTLHRALSGAAPLRAFRADRILLRADLDSPSGRDRAADEIAEVFAVYPPEVLLEADLLPAAQGIPMDVEKFRERVDAARHRLNERAVTQRQRQAASRYEAADYGYDDGGYPDDPGGDYDDYGYVDDDPVPADDGNDHATGVGTRAAGTRRRFQRQHKADARKQIEADVALLAAAASPESDMRRLMVPELFATPAGREAFARMTTEEDWTEQASGVADDPSAEDADTASEMLAAAADAGPHVSEELAKDRVATAWLHFVRATIDRISEGGDIPRTQIDPSLPAAAQLEIRHQHLRWLRDREPMLRQPDQRIGVAQELRDWLCSLGETATDDASTEAVE